MRPVKIPETELPGMWERCAQSDREARNLLVEHFIADGLLDRVIRGSGLQPCPMADFDDLWAVGSIGLIEAVERFQPERGWKFETYAITRIRGALLDEMRSLDWVPRTVRAQIKKVTRVRDEMAVLEGGMPTSSAIAERLGITTYEVEHAVYATSYAGPLAENLQVEDETQNPEQSAQRVALACRIATVVGSMGLQVQLLLSSYYIDHVRLRDIGTVLAITEARLSKMHATALAGLLPVSSADAS